MILSFFVLIYKFNFTNLIFKTYNFSSILLHVPDFCFTFVNANHNAPKRAVLPLKHNMKDRIRQIMESKLMTQQEFADFIGTTPATLSGIFNERTKPTLKIVEAIKMKIPDINSDWLLFGSGDMYIHPGMAVDTPHTPLPQGQGSNSVVEQKIDFGQDPAPTPLFSGQQPPYFMGVGNTQHSNPREEIKNVDKPKRHVTEIRVYYDDQTWESFVPSKK